MRREIDLPPPPPAPSPPARRHANGLLASFWFAFEGLLHTVVHQRNMKVHLVSAILVGLVGSGIALDLATKVTLIFCVLLVFFAEILNSALEALVDLHIERFDERARVTKDAAAAGVLVLSLGTAAIFAAVVITHWPYIQASTDKVARQVLVGIPLAALGSGLLWLRARPRWVDALAVGAGGLLLLLLASWTTSAVMTAMTTGLFALCAAAAWRSRRLNWLAPSPQSPGGPGVLPSSSPTP